MSSLFAIVFGKFSSQSKFLLIGNIESQYQEMDFLSLARC